MQHQAIWLCAFNYNAIPAYHFIYNDIYQYIHSYKVYVIEIFLEI